MKISGSEHIWHELADLFFLDTEPTEQDYIRVAELVTKVCWTSPDVHTFIVKYIAPNYAANLGFLIFPAIGEWALFDKKEVLKNVQKSINLRNQYPDWYFLISDWWYARMLKQLDFHRLEIEIQKILR